MAICLTCGEKMRKCICTDSFVENIRIIEEYREVDEFIENPITELNYN